MTEHERQRVMNWAAGLIETVVRGLGIDEEELREAIEDEGLHHHLLEVLYSEDPELCPSCGGTCICGEAFTPLVDRWDNETYADYLDTIEADLFINLQEEDSE